MDKLREYFEPSAQLLLAVIAVFIVLAVLVSLLGWRPPDEFTIATGRKGGAYYAYAEEYQKRFAELGYKLNIRETAGGIETIELLNRGEVDAGFVQNTVSPGIASPELSTLAAIYYEALWIFYRDDLNVQPTSVAELEGLRINVGEKGSATYETTQDILSLNGITADNATLSYLPTSEAAEQLKNGELDVLMTVLGASAPDVLDLLTTPGIALVPFRRSAAYTSRYKNVAAVVLPEGVVDLEANIPPMDTPMIAARATLVAGPSLHPDLSRLLLIVATEVHSSGGIFEAPNEFPSSTFVGIPMNADAARYLKNGPTILERYLPLWMASRLERFLLLLLPIALVVYPIVRGLPTLRTYFYNYRVKGRYQYLRQIDRNYQTYDRADLERALADLEATQELLAKEIKVPKLMLVDVYDLRYHTSLVQDRLQNRLRQLDDEGQGEDRP
jgi:TRAP transporter TAXI family solute receptor